MINRSVPSPEPGEDISFINTTFDLSTSINMKDNKTYLKSIKNITFVPRSGTHNNFKRMEEIILYVINGELLYGDSLGNKLTLKKGNILYINFGSGLSYEIFNDGIDYLDIMEINIIVNEDEEGSRFKSKALTPHIIPSSLNNDPIDNWQYRVSSKNGLAPIKSFCDINIYSLTLSSNKTVDFQIQRGRTGYLIQGYGSSLMEAEITGEAYDLNGSDGLKVCSENFTLKSDIDSDFILVEGP